MKNHKTPKSQILAINDMGNEALIRAALAYGRVYLGVSVNQSENFVLPPRAEARENFIRIIDALLTSFEVMDDILNHEIFIPSYDQIKDATLKRMDYDYSSLEGAMGYDLN